MQKKMNRMVKRCTALAMACMLAVIPMSAYAATEPGGTTPSIKIRIYVGVPQAVGCIGYPESETPKGSEHTAKQEESAKPKDSEHTAKPQESTLKNEALNEEEETAVVYKDFTKLRDAAEEHVTTYLADCADSIDEIDSVEIVTDYQEEKNGNTYDWNDDIQVIATLKKQYVSLVPWLPASEIYGMLNRAYAGAEAYVDEILDSYDAEYMELCNAEKIEGSDFTGTREQSIAIVLKAGKNTYAYYGDENGYYLNEKWIAVN